MAMVSESADSREDSDDYESIEEGADNRTCQPDEIENEDRPEGMDTSNPRPVILEKTKVQEEDVFRRIIII